MVLESQKDLNSYKSKAKDYKTSKKLDLLIAVKEKITRL